MYEKDIIQFQPQWACLSNEIECVVDFKQEQFDFSLLTSLAQ